MVPALPTAVSRNGVSYPERSFYIFRETEYLPKTAYLMLINKEISENTPKIKYISINFLSFDHIIFP